MQEIATLVIWFCVFCTIKGHYSTTGLCEHDHSCEYVYTTNINMTNQNINFTATVQIICESRGAHGSVPATRFCMTVTNIGGNLVNQNSSDLKEHMLQYFSEWFCFVQSSGGKVVSVFHSKTEDSDVVGIKKGIAASFQANFRRTTEETEFDTTSQHIAHYQYLDDVNGTMKMYRTFTSEDVMEYAGNISSQNVKLVQAEEIVYSYSTLQKSNGTMHINASIPTTNGARLSSELFDTHGSFLMVLNYCVALNHTARVRRNVQVNLDSENVTEDNLLAPFDEKKEELNFLKTMHKQLHTSEQFLKGIKSLSDNKMYMLFKEAIILEQKYSTDSVPLLDRVLNYLNGIDEYQYNVSQRILLYNLLSDVGNLKAQQALIEQLKSTKVLEIERQSLEFAIASVVNPSTEVIQTLEQMIVNGSDRMSSLFLVYGALVPNTHPIKIQQNMVLFLADWIPEDRMNNSEILVNILYALGNTQSPYAFEYIIQYLNHYNTDVKASAQSSLTTFIFMPSIHHQLLNILNENATDVVNLARSIVLALKEGYTHNSDKYIASEIFMRLINISIMYNDSDLQLQLSEMMDTPNMLENSRQISMNWKRPKRSATTTSRWDSTSPLFNVISRLPDRQQDVTNFPKNMAFLWSKTLGTDTDARHNFYLQCAAGAFAGSNNCDFKLMGKGVVQVTIMNNQYDVLTITAHFTKHQSSSMGKLYVKFGKKVLRNNESEGIGFSYSLPTYTMKIASLIVPFRVFCIPLQLRVDVYVNIGGSIEVSALKGTGIRGTISITPSATAFVNASVISSVGLARAGVALDGSITYTIQAEGSIDICGDNGLQIQNPRRCVTVTHEWSDIAISLAAFYQTRRWWNRPWGDRVIPGFLARNWTIPSSGGNRRLYNNCNDDPPPSRTRATPTSHSQTTPTSTSTSQSTLTNLPGSPSRRPSQSSSTSPQSPPRRPSQSSSTSPQIPPRSAPQRRPTKKHCHHRLYPYDP